jgi:hypothetical protein
MWSRRFGGAGRDVARGVAVDTNGDVLLVSDFTGSVDFGGGALQSEGDEDIFVAMFDGLGDHLWSLRSGGSWAESECRWPWTEPRTSLPPATRDPE